MRRRVLLSFSLLVLLPRLLVLAVCPHVCSCSRSHREVGCSWRGLRQLPDGLQHNLHSLNLSHNRLHNLDGQLTSYTHLRVLDLSHNRLSHLPADLPRSLWQLVAASNRIQLLNKNDTAYQWNLRTLDLASNKLERATFINNTLISLCKLNLSYNHFRTLPTNMPAQLESIDMSHNLLVKVLPGSLDRLPRLTHFYLHANRLSALPVGALDRLTSLRLITLGDNPWDCHLPRDITYVLSWTQHTSTHVSGCPCHTHPVCGGTGQWHFTSHNLPPPVESSSMSPEAPSVTGRWHVSRVSTLPGTTRGTGHHPLRATTSPPSGRTTDSHRIINHLSAAASAAAGVRFICCTEQTAGTSSITDTRLITGTPVSGDTVTEQLFTTESSFIQTKRTTTLRTRSVRRQNPSVPRGTSSSSSSSLVACSSVLLLNKLGVLSLIHVL